LNATTCPPVLRRSLSVSRTLSKAQGPLINPTS